MNKIYLTIISVFLLSFASFSIASESNLSLANSTSQNQSTINNPTTPINFVSEDSENQLWNLTADKVTSLGNGNILEAEGEVFLRRGVEYLKADFARYYPNTNWVYLKGNVDVKMGSDDIKAESAEFDLTSRTGWLKNGNIFMEGPHIYFKGENIVKHRGDRYTFENAKVTACDGDVPAWSVTANQAVVEIDGYAQLFGSTFQVADVGVLATPYMILPAKNSRQSGFLNPEFGLSNKRGIYGTIPYYHVIDDSRDVTFYGTFMENYGYMLTTQYRSIESAKDKTWIMASFMYDKDKYNTGTENPESNYARDNHFRYWIRAMADGELGGGWQFKTDIDFVSDADYLEQFTSGLIGFDSTESATESLFGRDLRDYYQKRLSSFLLFKDWQRFGVALSASYEQDQFLGNGNTSHRYDDAVQQLPRIDAFFYKGRVFEDFPLEFEAQASSSYMYREFGTRGLKTEFYPRVTLPLDLKYVSLSASAGVRQTFYNSTNVSNTSPLYNSYSTYMGWQKNPGQEQNGKSRTVPDFDIELYTDASKIFELGKNLGNNLESAGKSEWSAIRHELQPRIKYSYVGEVDQDDNPYYSFEDRLLQKRDLVFSLTNLVTVKRNTVTKVVDPKNPSMEPQINSNTSYFDLLRFKLESGYDFLEADRTYLTETFEVRPFMDIMAEIDLFPSSAISYKGKTFISPYTGDITRHDHDIIVQLFGRGTWTTGITYRTKNYELRRRLQNQEHATVTLETPSSLLENRINLNLIHGWSISAYEYRNLKTKDVYERSVDLAFTDQCYKLIFRMEEINDDRSFGFYFELPGLFD